MKKILLLSASLLLLAAGTTLAQDKIGARYDKAMEHYHTRFGIKGGPSLANLTVNNAGSVNDKRAIPAWHLGMYADVPLLPVLSVQAGVTVGMKGAKFTLGDNSSANYTEVSTRPIYLEVPVNAIVKIPLVNKVKLFVGAGPYAAVGIGGKSKIEGRLLDVPFSEESNIKYASNNNSSNFNSDLKRMDAGLNFLAGIEINKFTLNANYGHGLVNIKSGSDNSSAKYANRIYSLSVGLLF